MLDERLTCPFGVVPMNEHVEIRKLAKREISVKRGGQDRPLVRDHRDALVLQNRDNLDELATKDKAVARVHDEASPQAGNPLVCGIASRQPW